MAYNYKLRTKQLGRINLDRFRRAVFLAYKGGITSKAPLGYSGDTIVLHGTEEGGRKSVVSVRNYCGNVELLITDARGAFLFYGRYDINLGIDFVVKEYMRIFLRVKHYVKTNIPKVTDEFKKVEMDTATTDIEGYALLKSHQQFVLKMDKLNVI